MTSLQTERLELDPLMVKHAALLYPQLCDPVLYTFLDSEPPRSVGILESQYTKWEARRSPDGTQRWLNWAARLHEGDYIGWFQATVYSDHRADLAYLVFPAYQREGYASEACRAVIEHVGRNYHATKIRATIDAANTASIALARSLGLTRAGINDHGTLFESQIRR